MPDTPSQPFELLIKSRKDEAQGIISLSLVTTDGSNLPPWQAGAHIDLILGDDLIRQYSLCSDPSDRKTWKIAVLLEPESRGGSTKIHADLAENQTAQVAGPRNNFALEPAREYLLVAGGIGVTPLLTMARALDREGANWRMLYGGRTAGSMAFTDTLQAFGDKVQICPQDETGLLDLAAFIGSPRAGVGIYCCGPEPLIAAIEETAADWPEDTLHLERFQPKPGALDGDSDSFEVILALSGKSVIVAPDETIIDALDRVGLHVPRSCGEGTCGTCLTKVLDGMPDHRDSFLMGRKRAQNKTICVCCSRSKTPSITLKL